MAYHGNGGYEEHKLQEVPPAGSVSTNSLLLFGA